MSDQGSGMYTDVVSSGKKLLEHDGTLKLGIRSTVFALHSKASRRAKRRLFRLCKVHKLPGP